MTPARAVALSDLPGGPAGFVKAADGAGWWTVASVGAGEFDGRRTESVVVRGWRGDRRFVATWILDETLTKPGWKADAGYWWRREHQTVVEGVRVVRKWKREKAWAEVQSTELEHDPARDELVSWTSDRPTPDKIGISDLRKLLTSD